MLVGGFGWFLGGGFVFYVCVLCGFYWCLCRFYCVWFAILRVVWFCAILVWLCYVCAVFMGFFPRRVFVVLGLVAMLGFWYRAEWFGGLNYTWCFPWGWLAHLVGGGCGCDCFAVAFCS